MSFRSLLSRLWADQQTKGIPVSTSPHSALEGLRLRYLIGSDGPFLVDKNSVTEVSWGKTYAGSGPVIGYCNLFDEENTGRYAPYLRDSDTAKEWGEGEIDPKGPGWTRNLTEQFQLRKRQGIEYVELDNADSYDVTDVLSAIGWAKTLGLKVVAKNPQNYSDTADQVQYVAHPNVHGIIVECDTFVAPVLIDTIRKDAGKPYLPVWYVADIHTKPNALKAAAELLHTVPHLRNISITYSSKGGNDQYNDAHDIAIPWG